MNKAKYLNDVLTNFEAEDIISKQIKKCTFDTYGSEEFMRQHAILERLNMQAVKNALLGGDDFILENFVTYEKLKGLVEELFTSYNFKKHIYPKIKSQISEKSSCKVYILLYHEAVVLNILENFFFHVTACISIEDYIIDMVEYCYLKISKFLNSNTNEIRERMLSSHGLPGVSSSLKDNYGSNSTTDSNENKVKSSTDDMDEKFNEIEFYTAMGSISILRYITDHLSQLSFPVRNHIMNVKDVPLLLVALMDNQPWKIENRNGTFIYENNHWEKLQNNSSKISKLEGQVWIAIFNLFMNSENNKKYEITEFRKNTLLRLRKFMNETLFDQIPPLQQLFRALEEMSLMNVNNVAEKNPFVVEIIPILFNARFSEEEIKRLSMKIINDYFNISDNQMRKEMDIISEVYSVSNLDYFMEDPKCANCLKDATSRCSKCKSEWYCSRDCQIKRWKMHKPICAQLAELNVEDSGSKKVEEEIKKVKDIEIKKDKAANSNENKNSYKPNIVEVEPSHTPQEKPNKFDELD